jgi:chromosome segregation ATPase
MMPFGQILVALLDLQRTDPRAAELYHALIDHETEINQLLSEVRESELARLRAEHERVLGECRSVLAQITELEAQLPALENLLRQRQSATSSHRVAFAAKRDAKPSVGYPKYATPQHIAAYDDQVAEAQSRLTRAEQAEAAVVNEYNGIVNQIKAQNELLNGHRANIGALKDFDRPGLVEQESRLRAQIEGREWSDSSTGLKSTAAILT